MLLSLIDLFYSPSSQHFFGFEKENVPLSYMWLNEIYSHQKWAPSCASSETQGQIVGTRESLNRWKNMARRKVKNGEKSPWEQCITRPVPNGHRRSAFWLGRKTVRHCPQGLFSPFFTFLRAIFSRPFRLSLAPTICPWVSEDASCVVGKCSVWWCSIRLVQHLSFWILHFPTPPPFNIFHWLVSVTSAWICWWGDWSWQGGTEF